MIRREIQIELWAQVKDGEIIRNPGPRPYKVDGEIVQGFTDDELRKKYGFQQVLVEYDDQFDPDVQSMLEPEDFVEDGQAVRRHVYEFQPSARQTMLYKVNQHFMQLAVEADDVTPLQLSEYREVEDEVKRIRALDDGVEPDPKDFPYLAVDVGVTRDFDRRMVTNIKEAAAVAEQKAMMLRQLLREWRQQRLPVRADIREAKTDEAAFARYREIVPAPLGNQPWKQNL